MTGPPAAMRGLGLAARIQLRAKLKFSMLVTLIAVSLLVFLLVAELSRASRADLTSAIDADMGATGTYQVMATPDLNLTADEFAASMRSLAQRFGTGEPALARVLTPLQPECPPYEQTGEMLAAVLLAADGHPAAFEPGSAPASDLCLSGLVVPNESLREANAAEKAEFGVGLVLDPDYERAVSLTTTEPAQLVGVIVTGSTTDRVNELMEAAVAEFSQAAAFAGVAPEASVVIARKDSGERVRAASAGVGLVYTLIAWGVLLVSGLGIGIAELIVLKDRTWYFGLVRAVGGRRRDVAGLVLADILIVLGVGTGLALALATLLGPVVRNFGERAFQVDLQLIRPGVVPLLILGVSVMLVVGGVYPAWRATRLDPLDVLERR